MTRTPSLRTFGARMPPQCIPVLLQPLSQPHSQCTWCTAQSLFFSRMCRSHARVWRTHATPQCILLYSSTVPIQKKYSNFHLLITVHALVPSYSRSESQHVCNKVQITLNIKASKIGIYSTVLHQWMALVLLVCDCLTVWSGLVYCSFSIYYSIAMCSALHWGCTVFGVTVPLGVQYRSC